MQLLKKIIKKVGELKLAGMSDKGIAMEIQRLYRVELTQGSVRAMFERFKVRSSEVLNADEKLKEAFKEIVEMLIKEIKSNLNVIKNIRSLLTKLLRELKTKRDYESAKRLVPKIYAAVKTQNDCIRTATELMKNFETEREVEYGTAEALNQTLSMLKELERQGYIKILDKYFKEFEKEED